MHHWKGKPVRITIENIAYTDIDDHEWEERLNTDTLNDIFESYDPEQYRITISPSHDPIWDD